MGRRFDNIPGAPGIGEKGAKALIQEYDNIENVIAHAAEIPRKIYRESLQNNADLIRQSRELARIVCDMPIELDLKALIYEEPDRRLAYELFSELEFNTLTKEFADAASPEAIAAIAARQASPIHYSIITKPKALDDFIKSLWSKEGFAVSIAERKGKVYGLAISTAPSNAALIDFEKFKSGAERFRKSERGIRKRLVAKVCSRLERRADALEQLRRHPCCDQRNG